MLPLTPQPKIFLGIHPIDFRKGIDGIAALCQRQWQLDPMTGHLFIFRNRKRNALKILTYDRQGYWLAQKRLSCGRFWPWPTSHQAVVTLTPAQAQALLYNGQPAGREATSIWQLLSTEATNGCANVCS